MANTKPTAQTLHLQPCPRRAGAASAYVLWWLSDNINFDGDCWTWKGAKNRKGYGVVHLKNYDVPQSVVSVHRVVYDICVEPIPEGLCVLHRCDNPSCCRPDHLFVGSHEDNVADKVAKGRHRSPHGEAHGMARLTADMVRDIRRRASGGETPASIARLYSMSDTNARDIINRKTWKHLPDDLLLGKE